jgi:hypothetical protein
MIQEKGLLGVELDLNLDKDQAYEFINDSFVLDQQLRIHYGNLMQGALSVNYTNTSQYREGEYMDLSIYKIPVGNEIMITQNYPIDKWKKERSLRLFFKEVTKMGEGIDLPRNWYDVESKEWNSENLINRITGGDIRFNGLLNDIERYETIFLLYQKFFSEESTNLGISGDRLEIPKVKPEIVEDHMRALKMTRIIMNNPEKMKFYNYGTESVFGYDFEFCIACGVEMG